MSEPRIVALGECMIELSRGPDGQARIGFGGDTLNTALYMARLGGHVAYATALGGDPWSQEMREAWREEGLDVALALTDPDRNAGLYAIRTDDRGERSFTYWRNDSAARRFFDLPGTEAALEVMAQADLLYLSGITLSLFDDAGRARLAEVAEAVRGRGGDVAFDPNYRPRNWPSPEAARAAFDRFSAQVSMALPTYEDEAGLYGDADPEQTAARWRARGAGEIVIKRGPEGAICVFGEDRVSVPAQAIQPTDTTGAGDSFNAAYLHARLHGATPVAAAEAGNRLAAQVIQHPGAIMPRPPGPSRAA